MKKSKAGGKKKVSSPLSYRIVVPMIMLSLIQMSVFFTTLAVSGEFSYIKRYAYNMFTEKTMNRKNYVENMMNDKVVPSVSYTHLTLPTKA